MKTLAAALAAALAALAIAATANADPVNAKNATVFTGTCNGQTVQVVTNGNGEWTPAHVLGSTDVLIPQAFDLTFTATFDGVTETETETSAKKPHGDEIACTLPIELNTFTFPGGSFSVSGTVWVRIV